MRRTLTSLTVGAMMFALAAGCGALPPDEGVDPIGPVPPEGIITTDAALWPAVLPMTFTGGPELVLEMNPAVVENFVSLVSTFNTPGATTSERIIPLKSVSGTIVLGEETLSLIDARIELPDVVVGADVFPPDGLQLTNIALSVADVPAAVFQELDVDTRVAEVTLEVTLEWGLTLENGESFQLGDVQLASLPVVITLERDQETREIAVSMDGGAIGGVLVNSLLTVHEAEVSLRVVSGY